jgi:hypothetical protein
MDGERESSASQNHPPTAHPAADSPASTRSGRVLISVAQIRAVRSAPPLAKYPPWPHALTHHTGNACPLYAATPRFSSGHQMRIVASADDVRRSWESDVKSRLVTGPEWP